MVKASVSKLVDDGRDTGSRKVKGMAIRTMLRTMSGVGPFLDLGIPNV